MILNANVSEKAWLVPQTARLPGVRPVDLKDWFLRDDQYAAQCQYRNHLIDTHRDAVFQALPEARSACEELRDILEYFAEDEPALITVGRQVQEDICILQKHGEHHILTAGLMCFPSSWDITEKIGRSVADIHGPVPEFSPVQVTVERMLSAVRVEQPLARANFLIYTDAELHQARPEGVAKPLDPTAPRFVRVERQVFRRLPKSLAVVFTIHTSIIPARQLAPDEHAALARLRPELIPLST